MEAKKMQALKQVMIFREVEIECLAMKIREMMSQQEAYKKIMIDMMTLTALNT